MTMQLQVALDRLPLAEAERIAREVAAYCDWVEVGTSLVKEFGMDSVRRVVAAVRDVGDARVLADVKTNDNARYEFKLCFDSGARAATVMATSPDPTVDTCFAVARERGRTVMVDLLATTPARQRELVERYADGVFAVHVSKDVQEAAGGVGGGSGGGTGVDSVPMAGSLASSLPSWVRQRAAAVAGGVTLADVPALVEVGADLTVIVGSAITKAADPGAAARSFADAVGGNRPRDTAGETRQARGRQG